MLKIPILDISLKTINLAVQPHIPGANELSHSMQALTSRDLAIGSEGHIQVFAKTTWVVIDDSFCISKCFY